MKKKTFLYIGLALVIFGAGWWLGHSPANSSSGVQVSSNEEAGKTEFWTCSMHPQIRQPRPGKCPICGMDLIPVAKSGGGTELGPRQIKLTEAGEKLAEVEVASVRRQLPTVNVRMVGKVAYDETRLSYITAWIPGRLDRLYVDYTGVTVKKGDHLVSLYSPELLAAQEELIQALNTAKDLEQSELSLIRERAQATIESSREKLRLWGLKPEQIREIERSRQPSDHMTIYAPMSGVVVHKDALEGMYVNTGTRIYTIADLNQVWVKLDAYESDLTWLHYGQEVEFQTEAWPGETFTGRISFIDPVLDPKTRTVKVRVNVPNPDGRLKPEMFVRATVRSRVAEEGRVMDPELAGKWISPMHPEIIKDEPGTCDICGMDLVSAKSLGYLPAEPEKQQEPLVIPASAPLITGQRAVVYVAVPDKPGVYEGREIVLGPRAEQGYIVRQGLKEGEKVVVHGSFKIDSAVQIQAKPSMMNPQGGGPAPGHDHGEGQHSQPKSTSQQAPASESGSKAMEESAARTESTASQASMNAPVEFSKQLARVYEGYSELHAALVRDDISQAKQAAADCRKALEAVEINLVQGEAHHRWMEQSDLLDGSLDRITQAETIDIARTTFESVAETLRVVIHTFGLEGAGEVYVVRCPMAFDGRGARWLQSTDQIQNPYFGSKMKRCGNIVETLNSNTSTPAEPEVHNHE